jgi:hypothetical protein
MERRKIADRRKLHMFFSDERRTGPFDRRNADARRRERAQEMEKIKKIRQFRENETPPASSARPILTRTQLVAVGLALLLLAIVLVLFN